MITMADVLQSLRPTAEYMTYGNEYSGINWVDQTQTKPTEAEVDAEFARLTGQVPLNDCKAQAVALLQATDWTTIPDVADPAVSTPYLMNQAAFAAYRSQVRALAVNPVTNPVFPAQPNEEWSQT
jgi:hypothetical protein